MYHRQQKTAGKGRRCENRGILAPQVGFFIWRDYEEVISAGRDSYIGAGGLLYMNVLKVNKANTQYEHMYDIPASSSLPGPGSYIEHMSDSLNTTLANRFSRTYVWNCVILNQLSF